MSTFHNRTRRTTSIPRRLVREGKLHLLPVYYLGLTTALGKEAIENSGSYDFADHIYGNRPAGKFLIGYLLDALFLNLKSARSFRSRYLYARSEIQRAADRLKRIASLTPIALAAAIRKHPELRTHVQIKILRQLAAQQMKDLCARRRAAEEDLLRELTEPR